MSEPCSHCGAAQLVTVRLPGHDDIEAVLCLTCTTVQPLPVDVPTGPPSR